ncbi:MAG: hypothetical protein EAX86_06860 [Candidatus Heimdallarchaeota archaeon]|nr:hypothetical protein [Candidatus Heimdallarchaeota archaeon]
MGSGRQLQFRRALWKPYTKNSVSLIFVIDVSEPKRYPEGRTYRQKILSFTHLETFPLGKIKGNNYCRRKSWRKLNMQDKWFNNEKVSKLS